jgi:hypothetical protein
LSQLPQKKLVKTLKYLKKDKKNKEKTLFQIDLNLLSEDVNNFITEIRQNGIV